MSDLINRKSALKALRPIMRKSDYFYEILKAIQDIPPAEPERKTGKWKGYNADNPKWQRTDGTPIFLVCSECNGSVLNNGSAHWNFCPNCGADMRGKE